MNIGDLGYNKKIGLYFVYFSLAPDEHWLETLTTLTEGNIIFLNCTGSLCWVGVLESPGRYHQNPEFVFVFVWVRKKDFYSLWFFFLYDALWFKV